MLLHIEPDTIYKLFHNDPDCASKIIIPNEHRLQFMFLAVIRQLRVPFIIRSYPVTARPFVETLTKFFGSSKKPYPQTQHAT